MSLVGDGQRAGHTGDAAADHQRRLVHRQIDFLQGVQQAGARHRHAGDVLGLFGGVFLFAGMNPGAVLPDIGHFEVILVNAALPERIAEQRFQGPGGAGGHNHPVELFFLDGLRDGIGRIGGTGKQLLGSVDNVRKRLAIFHHRRHIDHFSDIGAAMAYKNTDPGLFCGHIFFGWVGSFGAQLPAPVIQKLTALGARAAGGKNRFRDIHGALKGAADKDPGAGGLHGIGGSGLAKSV